MISCFQGLLIYDFLSSTLSYFGNAYIIDLFKRNVLANVVRSSYSLMKWQAEMHCFGAKP